MNEMMTGGAGQVITGEVKFNGNVARVTSLIVAAKPEADTKSQVFTREDFENSLDRASRADKTPERA